MGKRKLYFTLKCPVGASTFTGIHGFKRHLLSKRYHSTVIPTWQCLLCREFEAVDIKTDGIVQHIEACTKGAFVCADVVLALTSACVRYSARE